MEDIAGAEPKDTDFKEENQNQNTPPSKIRAKAHREITD